RPRSLRFSADPNAAARVLLALILRAEKSKLPPGFIHDHCHRVGEIEAAVACSPRQAEPHVGLDLLEDRFREAARFRTEYEHIARRVQHLRIDSLRFSGESEHAPLRHFLEK